MIKEFEKADVTKAGVYFINIYLLGTRPLCHPSDLVVHIGLVTDLDIPVVVGQCFRHHGAIIGPCHGHDLASAVFEMEGRVPDVGHPDPSLPDDGLPLEAAVLVNLEGTLFLVTFADADGVLVPRLVRRISGAYGWIGLLQNALAADVSLSWDG